VTPNTITTEDVKQSVYNNGNDKIAKDAEDRAKKTRPEPASRWRSRLPHSQTFW
jgi:hypothetical protein